MCHKRFSKLLLVVLALAFWAGTAYGQYFVASTPAGPYTLSYTLGGGSIADASTQEFALTNTDSGTQSYSFVASPGLAFNCNGDVSLGGHDTVPCTISVDPAAAVTLGAGVHNNLTVAFTTSFGADLIITVNLTIYHGPQSNNNSLSLTYLKGGGAGQLSASATSSISTDDTNTETFTANKDVTCPGWLDVGTPTAISSVTPDLLTFSVNSALADAITGGATGSCPVTLVHNTVTFATVTVSYTITPTGSSPLSLAVPGSITLTYVRFGGAQTLASATATIDSTDSASETMTVTVQGGSPPAWLTATPVTGFTQASSGTPGKVTFAITPGALADALSPGAGGGPYTVNIVVGAQPALAVTVIVVIQAQSLAFTTTSAALSYTAGASAASITATAVVKSTLGSVAFTPDAATVPWWLSVAGATANNTAGATVTFTGIPTVLPALAVGNYSKSVGFVATVTPAGGVAEFFITVTLSVTSGPSTISLGAAPAAVILQPNATPPTPTVVAVSSNDPVGFTATCQAQTSNTNYTPTANACLLKSGGNPSGASITGVAYTWGVPIGLTLEGGLFSNTTPFGTQVTVTVTVTPSNGSAAPNPVQYVYNFQPVAATLDHSSPTSVVGNGTAPVVVTIVGANFVPPGLIIGGSLSATQLFLATTASTAGVPSGWAAVTANVVVVSGSVIVVTLPASSLPTFTPSATVTSAKLYLGVANQTGATAPSVSAPGFKPDAFLTVTATTNPVIYAVTSTATYLQPATLGALPTVSPYELVSIFGANFGVTSAVIATPDSVYNKYPTALTVGTSGTGTSAKNIVLKVNFTGTIGSGTSAKATTYAAPILFANGDQINLVVPSGLNLGNITVSVSSGTTATPPASDNFPVSYIAADPGIFTLTSTGTGQGAILNPGGVVNGPGYGAQQAVDTIAIYMTGLGTPNSAATDNASNTITSGTGYPGNCVSVASYLTLVNTSVTTGTKYTAPSPIWTGLEGALMTRVLAGLPPCMLNNVGPTTATVTFNPGTAGAVIQPVGYAGFVSSSVAGLYQVNVAVPAGLTTVSDGPVTVPVVVTINGITSPPVNVVVKP